MSFSDLISHSLSFISGLGAGVLLVRIQIKINNKNNNSKSTQNIKSKNISASNIIGRDNNAR